jgi:hypothetical protein
MSLQTAYSILLIGFIEEVVHCESSRSSSENGDLEIKFRVNAQPFYLRL